MKKSKKFIIMSVVFVLIIVVAVCVYLFYKSIPYTTITSVLYMYDTSIPEQAYKNEYIPEGAEDETRHISKYDVNYEE